MLGVLLFTSLACAHKQVSTMVAPAPEASRVLVVVNANSKVSEELGRFYMRTRVIPTQNLLEVKTGTEDDITFDDYKSKILDPIEGDSASDQRQGPL